jgi:RNA polymerase sigma factor (sigma-70 family)
MPNTLGSTDTSDAQLLRDYAEHGTEAAFAQIVARHTDLVYSAALRQCGSPETAREIAQSVFTDLARKALSVATPLTSDASLIGWLYHATRYAALTALRSERRRLAREQLLMQQHDSTPSLESDWSLVAPVLDEAMEELNDGDREAVLLRFFKNLDFAAVGRALGVSDDAAQKRVSRAVERLRELLAKRGVTASTGGLAAMLVSFSIQTAPTGLTSSMVATATQSLATKVSSPSAAWAGLGSVSAKIAIVAVILVSIAAIRWTASKEKPFRLPTGNREAKISMGAWHGFILASDGSLWTWGTNYLGWPVLGLGSTNLQTNLRRVGNDNDWVDISTSFSHALAVKSDGTIWGWGENIDGQLGNGFADKVPNQLHTTPKPTVPGNDWKKVAAGGAHSLAIKKDGTLWGWGNNWAGQLGLNHSQHEVLEVTQVGTNAGWVKVWAGNLHSIALRADGSLWSWGSLTGKGNDGHSLLIPTRVSPDTNWIDAGFGYYVMFAIKSDGTLWAWGRNAGIYTGEPIELLNPVPKRVGAERDWKACSTSEYFYRVFEKKDGSLWALDASDYAYVSKASYKPVQWKRIPLEKDIVAFGAASRGITGVVLTRDGEVRTWGQALGQFTPAYPTWQAIADKFGWKTDRFRSKPVVHDAPWQLPHDE